MLFKTVIFIVASGIILYVSWPSLSHPRSHGFYRFFAFEAVLSLILLNTGSWFNDPFAPAQIISWLLLLSSLALVAHGLYLLRQIGKPAGRIENTTNLVTQGIYRHIRHPLYSSLLFLGWGAFLKQPAPIQTILVAVTSIFVVVTARVEEKENLAKFGNSYAEYMKKTRMFIPYLF